MQFFTCWHSQRRNERRFHLAICWGFGVLCLALLPVTEIRGVHTASFVLLVLGVVGVFGVEGISVSYYLALMGGEKNVGVAIINTIGALGGFAGPYLIGAFAHSTGHYYAALWLLSACLLLAVVNACKQPGLDAHTAFISVQAWQLAP
jgi:nitrate/nitrite transporter NarK